MTTLLPPPAVLVVDDNIDAADSLAMVLRTHGHTVRTAQCGLGAAAAIRDGFRPAAVLMDIGLPGANGYAVARDLCAALGYRPLLVAVTGHQHLEVQSEREGFDLHFLKPMDPALILEALEVGARRHGDRANRVRGAE